MFLDTQQVLKILFFKELSVNESKPDKFNFPSIKKDFLKVQEKGAWSQMCFGFQMRPNLGEDSKTPEQTQAPFLSCLRWGD